MKLIVGLGNPGAKYEKTRHNLGFMVVEKFLKGFEPVKNTSWENSSKFKSDIAQIEWQPKHGSLEKIILVKPKTYMNNSGLAIQILATYYKIPAIDVWVVHDDIDLPLGSMRIRLGGGFAGHHGVESVIEKLGTDKFWRFRLGIGEMKEESRARDQGLEKKKREIDDFVLGNFIGREKGKLKELIKRGVKSLEEALENGLESAMNRF